MSDEQLAGRPVVTTLCGSARFAGEMLTEHRRLAQNGRIVIPLDPVPTPGELHLRKIDLSDGIYVVNVSGYVGAATRAEIEYALANGKTVEWLSPPDATATQPDPAIEALTEIAGILMQVRPSKLEGGWTHLGRIQAILHRYQSVGRG